MKIGITIVGAGINTPHLTNHLLGGIAVAALPAIPDKTFISAHIDSSFSVSKKRECLFKNFHIDSDKFSLNKIEVKHPTTPPNGRTQQQHNIITNMNKMKTGK